MGCSDSKNASDGVMVNRPSSIPHGLKEDHFDGPPQPPAALNALPHNLRARYKLGAQLGEGAYSVVRLGTSTVGDFQVAVKVVDRHNLPKDDENALRAEVEMLKELKHNNIVQCYDFFEEQGAFYVVLEFIEGGELFDRIVKKTCYNEKEARDTVFTILRAIKYCHDRDVVHRDLKPENLLLASKTDDSFVKIADFGFAIRSQGNTSLKTQCGTPGYVAPEILNGDPYGKPVDMWSIGVITYILLGGYPPFYDENQSSLYSKIRNAKYEFHPDYWGNVSHEAKDLIRGLLTLDPNKRLTAEKAMYHPWLRADPASLASRNLDANLGEFKKFHASRKLKGAVKAVIATNKMKSFVKDMSLEREARDSGVSREELDARNKQELMDYKVHVERVAQSVSDKNRI